MTGAVFIVVLVASFTIVRIGAIAFQLTGLDWSLAKFQALSCFTGTGFTTREAELVTGNAQRRRIASVLMVLGNAGLVLMIATIAQSFRAEEHIWASLSQRFLPFEIPSYAVPWVNLGLLVLSVYLVESGLRGHDIIVLAIVREGQTVANPPANMKILRNDELICFGKLGNIRSRILMNP